MKTVNEKYLSALCEMHEDDFTKKILKPLFEAMGYKRVDFNGGPYERGRDLIAQRKIPPRESMHVTYIQSKKIGKNQNTESAAKYTKLVHQLRQCCTEEITDMEGNKLKADEIYIASPEQITNRFMEEIESQLFENNTKVHPYDGVRIISDIKEYKPELLDLLTDIKDKLTDKNFLSLGSDELLSALKNVSKINIDEFYSDLSFFVGSVDSNLLLHLNLEAIGNVLNIKEDSWQKAKHELEKISEKHDINLLSETIGNIEKKYNSNKKSYLSKINKERRDDVKNLTIELKELDKNIKNNVNTFPRLLREAAKKDGISDVNLEKMKVVVTDLKASYSDRNSNLPEDYIVDINEGKDFYRYVNNTLSWISDKRKIENKITKIQFKIVGEPFYVVDVDIYELIAKIDSYKEEYFKSVDFINKKQIGLPKLRKFLTDTEKTLSILSSLKSGKSSLSKLLSFKSDDDVVDRVSISPHDIFSTGHDIAVYGEAGVGKTTTLQSYANTILADDSIVSFYIPLNKLVDELKETLISNSNFFDKELVIKMVLLSRGVRPIDENIEEARKIITDKTVLILDGLDEIYSTIPQIIPAISEFKIKYKSAQLIVSSRDCVSYLGDIDFIGITLLPFTEEQLKKFIRGWLKNEEKSESLIASIEKKNLYEHIKTPLLATITCTLIEKGINAPSTETEIYSERLRLLTGEYDLHKKIDRQKQKGNLLRKCAKKIAYYMHSKNLRLFSKENMHEALCASLSDNYDKGLLLDCLEELVDPCNLIYKEHVSSAYSFGHFRFQEHLALEELISNRSVDLAELVVNDWWRGVLCLYAQDNDFLSLFEEVYNKFGNLVKAQLTLEAMIENSTPSSRVYLNDMFKRYSNLHILDEEYYDDEFSADEFTRYL